MRAELYFAIFARLAGVIPLASNTWSPGADSPKSSTPSTFGAERVAWVPWVSFRRRVFLTAGTPNCPWSYNRLLEKLPSAIRRLLGSQSVKLLSLSTYPCPACGRTLSAYLYQAAVTPASQAVVCGFIAFGSTWRPADAQRFEQGCVL